MTSGFGFGFGFTGGNVLIINDAIVLATGQSLQDRLFTADSGAGDTAFQAEAAIHFPGTVTHTDAAATNQYLTKSSYDASGDTGARYYWNDENSTKGPRYTAEIDPVTDKDTYTAVKVDLGQSDGINTSFPHTKSEYKTFYKEWLAQIKSDFPNAIIFLNILNRTRQTGDFDAGYNLVRQAQLEIIDEVSYVQRGIDVYDLPMIDNFHLTNVGAAIYGQREARRIANHYGKLGAGSLGPYITNLVSRTDRIEFDVVHDAGTDWTAPSGTGAIAVEDDGTATGDVSITKTDATSGVIVLPEGEAPAHGSTLEGFVNYGDGGALGATASVAVDNATNFLPFRSAANISVTNGDPIQDLDNISFRLHARGSAKTYSSGNVVDAITALEGINFSEVTAGNGPEFTTNYIEIARNTDRLSSDDELTETTTRTIGLAGKMPSSLPTFGTLFGFTNSSNTWSNNARVYLDSNGRLNYQEVDSGSRLLMSDTFSGSDDFILFIRFNSVDEAEAFVNSTSVTATINPLNTYSLASRKLGIGDSSNQPTNALLFRIYDIFMTDDVLTDQEIQDIYDFWGAQFSLSL